MTKKLIAIILIFTILEPFVSKSFGQRVSDFNRDKQIVISKTQFDKLIDTSIILLQTKELSDISDSGHINIMMCLNTISMAHDTTFQRRFVGGRYEKFQRTTVEKKYAEGIINIYQEWIPNRGMGFYFPKLRMELNGTPSLYAWFKVGK